MAYPKLNVKTFCSLSGGDPLPRFLKTKKAKPITILLIIRKNHGMVLKSKRIILLTRRAFYLQRRIFKIYVVSIIKRNHIYFFIYYVNYFINEYITKAEKYSFPRKIKCKIMEGYYE